jgi:hypothetical protein
MRNLVTGMLSAVALVSVVINAAGATDPSLVLFYSGQLSGTGLLQDGSGNGFHGTLKNGSAVRQIDSLYVLELGDQNGYVDMGTQVGNVIAGLNDFTVATCLYLDPTVSISGNGYFVWTFSTSAACTQYSGKYIAYRVNTQRYAQSTGGWANEKVVVALNKEADKGTWMHVCYTQQAGTGRLYLNGNLVASAAAAYVPAQIGSATQYNWIGRPAFSGDSYLTQASLTDFRLYSRALSAAEIVQLATRASHCNQLYAKQELLATAESLTIQADTLWSSLTLPVISSKLVTLTWQSSNPAVLGSNGEVTRPTAGSKPVQVTLTAILSTASDTVQKAFNLIVMPSLSDEEAVAKDTRELLVNGNLTALRENLYLPVLGAEGSQITWKSSNPAYLNDRGEIVRLPLKGEDPVRVILTATIQKGAASASKTFELTLTEKLELSAYLFVYFTGNSGDEEAIRFALSPDAIHFRALNGNLPVIGSDTIAAMKAVRDPHILRGNDGLFYMVATDMKSANGWNSNHGMVLLKSSDLIHWTHSTVDIAALFPAFSTVNRVWAPQTIWDPQVGKYMIYWSMRSGSDPDVIYYAYANDDFTSIETTPQVLVHHPDNKACIDGDIIYYQGRFNLFVIKDGVGNGIKKMVSSSVTGPYVFESQKYFQQTASAVEGGCVFRLIDSDTCFLIYDVYTSGRYEFTQSTDLENFRIVNGVSMNFAPRHGTIIPITNEEATMLAKKWGTASDLLILSAGSGQVKRLNMVTDAANRTIVLPVQHGTDLTHFDPQIQAMPGITVTPTGPQDFSQGPVSYRLGLNGNQADYQVSAAIHNNPVIPDLYADPEILYAEKTGKFYIYSTSDGYSGWYGRYFPCFSSNDLVHWTNEGTIIDWTSGQVSWASTYAWAPCIIEKKNQAGYRYFFYFTANKQIGVAVADDPTGPFTDSGQPLIHFKPTGVTGGQEIDPDVFQDPVSGKCYLYWGNGYMAGAELNDDMVSIKQETVTVMTPDATFREGSYVFYRNGLYYFMWSENDTGSPDYRVRYGTATSPLGPITVPASNLVISRNDALAIYGPGHNAVLQLPGKDEWYIVYHRLNRPNALNYATPGNYREICIDRLEFNKDGSIRPVIPTLEGISPLVPVTSKPVYRIGSKNALTCWPNPSKELLQLDFPASSSDQASFEVKVMTLTGQLAMRTRLNFSNPLLDCTGLKSGVYLLKAELADDNYQACFIKG